jgi:predicted aconitase with swiveling domain
VALTAEIVLAGAGRGPVLRLDRPLSFWGGVDPGTGIITDPESGAAGRSLAGTVLMLPATRGSSSSSAVMLELVARGRAPAAVVLGRIDAILGLGLVVAAELGHAPPPLLRLDAAAQAAFADGAIVAVGRDGTIALV